MLFLFDWGNTLMKVFPDETGPMYQWKRVELCPGADRMLEVVSGHHSCYLVTNAADSSRKEIEVALERVGILNCFSGIFCSRDSGYMKPSRDYFLYILDALDCLPDSIVMVGDDPATDCRWAAENGARTVLYDPAGNYPETSFRTIRSLHEIPGLFLE